MTINDLNNLPSAELHTALLKCCGAARWVDRIMAIFPVNNKQALMDGAIRCWNECTEKDWLEAFTHHPQIGDVKTLRQKFTATANWAEDEQAGVSHASEETIRELADKNKMYKEKFGYIFIVCATGKTASEMLRLLNERMHHTPQEEIHIAMKEQQKITLLRLEKLLQA